MGVSQGRCPAAVNKTEDQLSLRERKSILSKLKAGNWNMDLDEYLLIEEHKYLDGNDIIDRGYCSKKTGDTGRKPVS